MITLLQEREIIKFLLTKKLSHGLFLEIKDHFIQQISTLMEEQSLDFYKAFSDVKLSWKDELELVRADLFSFRKVTKIEKEILQRKFRNIIVYSVVFSLLLSVLMYLNLDMFIYSQIIMIGMMSVLVGYNFIFRRMKLYNYMQLSFHPLLIKNAIVGILLFSVIYFLYNDIKVAGSAVMKVFFLYAMAVKIQLLYYNVKKTNVLI